VLQYFRCESENQFEPFDYCFFSKPQESLIIWSQNVPSLTGNPTQVIDYDAIFPFPARIRFHENVNISKIFIVGVFSIKPPFVVLTTFNGCLCNARPIQAVEELIGSIIISLYSSWLVYNFPFHL